MRATGAWIRPRVDNLAGFHANDVHAALAAGAGIERDVDVLAVIGHHREVAKRYRAADLYCANECEIARIDEG